MTTAFVLGGGGLLGAHEVGMLRALTEAGVRPDLVAGTSIGALNGVLVAADPLGAAERLTRMWQGEELRAAFSEKLWGRGSAPAGARARRGSPDDPGSNDPRRPSGGVISRAGAGPGSG